MKNILLRNLFQLTKTIKIELVNAMLDLNQKAQKAKGWEKEQIQRQIENTDREIDELVYKLYGISEEEKRIIEQETPS